MQSFINTSKELFYGNRYFREHVAPDDFDCRVHKKELSPYYAQHGFKVSMMYNDYFSRLNGICSDRYMSMDLYYMYVLPCLNRRDMQRAYADKNAYSEIFAGTRQPECVVKNINGFFRDSCGVQISKDKAIALCLGTEGCIIKPTVETGDGVGVERFDGSSEQGIDSFFSRYISDFTVQKRVRQHEKMALLNPSSLNSMRLMTYRALDGNINFLSGKTFLRVGGKGSCKDNVSAGGGMMHVDDDGKVSDIVVRYKTMELRSLKDDYGVEVFYVPNFEDAISLVLKLHEKMWYCDFCGWDIAIGEDGAPVFVEVNVVPACESVQQGSGPIFEGWILDEIMARLSCVKKSKTEFSINRFRPGFDHLLQIGGEAVHVN